MTKIANLAEIQSFNKWLCQGLSNRLRLGLISPYTGSNLGDAAIIESARFHLERVFPGVELVLIVLDCERVSRLHDLKSFPLTAVRRSFYFSPKRQSGRNSLSGENLRGRKSQSTTLSPKIVFKEIAKRMPFALNFARWARDTSQAIVPEMRHFRQAKQLMQHLDGLIIAGGGQFDDEFGGPLGHPYALYKWVRQARKKRVPAFFAGVGVCEVNHSLTKWFLKHTIEKANRVSLRDKGSSEILRRLGIRDELISCPDLSFGLPVGDRVKCGHTTPGLPLHIGLSPIAYGMPGNWPTENLVSFDRYWNEFKSLGVRLLQAGHRITLFATDDADVGLIKELHEYLLNEVSERVRLRILPALTLPGLLTVLPTFDAVIAGRLHGVILSHINGIPALGISYHRKVQAHMADIGQEKYSLDFMAFNASDAMELLDDVLCRKEFIATQLRRIYSIRREEVEREFGIIGKELSATRIINETLRE